MTVGELKKLIADAPDDAKIKVIAFAEMTPLSEVTWDQEYNEFGIDRAGYVESLNEFILHEDY